MDPQSPQKGGIDPAALAIAAFAAAASLAAPSGPYDPTSMVMGVTILSVVFAYDKDPARDGFQKFAFSAVCSLITLLALGYLFELLWAWENSLFGNPRSPSNTKVVFRLRELLREQEEDLTYSQIPPWFYIVVWLGLVILYYRTYPPWWRPFKVLVVPFLWLWHHVRRQFKVRKSEVLPEESDVKEIQE